MILALDAAGCTAVRAQLGTLARMCTAVRAQLGTLVRLCTAVRAQLGTAVRLCTAVRAQFCDITDDEEVDQRAVIRANAGLMVSCGRAHGKA